MSTLFWKEYINIYCIEQGRTGMTIPNIVGSVRINTNFKEYSIHNFLEEVLREEYEILISYCTDYNELVVGKFKSWHAPKNYYQKLGSIYFSQKDFEGPILKLPDLILELEKRYNIRISNETYSKDEKSNSWVFLSVEDKLNHLLVKEKISIK